MAARLAECLAQGELREREAVRADVVRTEPVRKAAVADGDCAERPLDILDEHFAAC